MSQEISRSCPFCKRSLILNGVFTPALHESSRFVLLFCKDKTHCKTHCIMHCITHGNTYCNTRYKTLSAWSSNPNPQTPDPKPQTQPNNLKMHTVFPQSSLSPTSNSFSPNPNPNPQTLYPHPNPDPVAVCCSILQCIAERCRNLTPTSKSWPPSCKTRQHTATHRNVSQHIATHTLLLTPKLSCAVLVFVVAADPFVVNICPACENARKLGAQQIQTKTTSWYISFELNLEPETVNFKLGA